jgi:hypothetical protein
MFENILWIAIGFIPTYIAMELAWKIAAKRNGIISKRNSVAELQAASYIAAAEQR